MSPALRVLAPGLLTTVQDLGRSGHQHLGIAVSGALDPVSLQAANALAGNSPGAGALEVAYLGPTLAVEADDVRLAFAGARAAVEVLPDENARTGTRIEGMRSIRLHRGEIVRIGALSGSNVLYVAVEGGFDIPPLAAEYVRQRKIPYFSDTYGRLPVAAILALMGIAIVRTAFLVVLLLPSAAGFHLAR